jgi:cysteine-rich repeat protein
MRTLSQLIVLGAAAAALAACSVDTAVFQPEENCEIPGDEDGDGLADCDDPVCTGTPSCPIACGNGRTEPGEACDDGNLIDGDGCDRNCTVSQCGNGIAAGDEVCDDGNLIDGDGCESTCVGTGSGSYEATADAMIRISPQTTDASTNYGTRPELFTFGSSFGTIARSLIAFDLSAVPVGPPIVSAHLHVRMVGQAGTDYFVGVHEVLGPWSETAVTWNNRPSFSPVPEASLRYQGYTEWRFDVTALVQRWVSMQSVNRGLVLVQSPETFPAGGQYAHFDSREAASRPYLQIVVGI